MGGGLEGNEGQKGLSRERALNRVVFENGNGSPKACKAFWNEEQPTIGALIFAGFLISIGLMVMAALAQMRARARSGGSSVVWART